MIERKEYRSAHIQYSAPVQLQSLTEGECRNLYLLNQHLVELEQKINKEAAAVKDYMAARKARNDSFLHDYELEVGIGFWLQESDPDSMPKSDNLLLMLESSVSSEGILQESIEPRGWELVERFDGNLNKSPYSYILHCAQEHSRLSWKDLLRVGTIWTDVSIIAQNRIEIEHAGQATPSS
jgi:hypothetical protein